MSYPYWPNGSLVGYQTLAFNSTTNVLTITPAGNSVTMTPATLTTSTLEAPAGDPLTLVGEHGSLVVGNTSASNGLTIAGDTISPGAGNTELIVARGSGTSGFIDFFAGLVNGVVPTAGTQELRVTSAGIETPQLTLDGAVFTNPKPQFFNWSVNNPGGSMVLPSLGTLDVTSNFVVNSAHLYRITIEVYMVQSTPATGIVGIYTDTSPIVYADNIPTSSITPALDFRRSYCFICNPSDSTLKILVNNTSTQQVNLTWLPILLEDLGVQPTAPV
jgi:hypothetical protein